MSEEIIEVLGFERWVVGLLEMEALARKLGAVKHSATLH